MLNSTRTYYLVMLLFILTVGLYYGSLLEMYSRPNAVNIDDDRLMLHLSNHTLTLDEVFYTGRTGKYYRPFLGLSYLLDQLLYGDMLAGYRLTNILIHALNVMLLFLTTRILLQYVSRRDEIAFFAALLFAVHPIAVESVAWISGRTDSLATFWSLLTVLLYLLGREKRRWYLLLVAFFCACAAILSKEVAIVTPIIIAVWESSYRSSFGYDRYKFWLPAAVFMSIAIPLYITVRMSGLAGGDMAMSLVQSHISEDTLLSTVKRIVASLGFYSKKFIYPFPLNVAIAQINTALYAFIGVCVLSAVAGLFYFKKIRMYHFFLLWAVVGIGPAVLISITDIAWTPWAERYLYFSLVPLSILAVIVLFSVFERVQGRARQAVPLLGFSILLIFSAASIQRSFVWNENFRIWSDTYKKSPGFIYVATGYAGALYGRGRTAEAELVLNDARAMPGHQHVLLLHLGHISRGKGEMGIAKEYYREALQEARADPKLLLMGPSLKSSILMSLADVELAQAGNSRSGKSKHAHHREAIRNLQEAYSENPSNRFLLYRIAKLALITGSKDEAAQYFREFIKKWRSDFYQEAARKMLKDIEKNDVR